MMFLRPVISRWSIENKRSKKQALNSALRALALFSAVLIASAVVEVDAARSNAETVTRDSLRMKHRQLSTVKHVYNEGDLDEEIAADTYIILEADIGLTAQGADESRFEIDGIEGLTIDGQGHTMSFSTSDDDNGRIFHISSGSEVEMVDLILTNGYVYGTALFSAKTRYGGAILVEDSALLMIGCTLSNNIVQVSGEACCFQTSIHRPGIEPTWTSLSPSLLKKMKCGLDLIVVFRRYVIKNR